jgi:hypothetical protein
LSLLFAHPETFFQGISDLLIYYLPTYLPFKRVQPCSIVLINRRIECLEPLPLFPVWTQNKKTTIKNIPKNKHVLFQIEVLHKKTVMCFQHEEKCYGALYNQKNEDSKSARDEMTPKKIDRLKNKFPKLELWSRDTFRNMFVLYSPFYYFNKCWFCFFLVDYIF